MSAAMRTGAVPAEVEPPLRWLVAAYEIPDDPTA